MTTLAKQAHSEPAARHTAGPLVILEGITLLLAAPWLLFPDISPVATAAALAALALVWLLALALDRDRLPRTPFNLAFLLWGLALAVGILVSADPSETLSKATGALLGLAASVALLAATAAVDPAKRVKARAQTARNGRVICSAPRAAA